MPLILLIIGLLLVVTGFQDTYKDFGAQIQKDFTGNNNFFYWVAAITVIGAIGYAKPVRNASNLFLFLCICTLIIANKGVFANLQAAIQQGTSKNSTVAVS